jgi:hypothetical protein
MFYRSRYAEVKKGCHGVQWTPSERLSNHVRRDYG